MGNYVSFGGMKFIPELSSDRLLKLLKSNPEYVSDSSKGKLYKLLVDETYPEIEKEIYALEKPYR